MGGRLTLCATGTLLAVLLTACGGGGNGSTPAPAVSPTARGLQVGPARDFGDACRLLSPAEVQSGTGVGPVIGASRSDPQLGSSCTYTQAAGGSSVPVLTVQVVVRQSAAAARSDVEQTGGPVLSGVGDVARSSMPGGLGVAVYLARGATYAALSSIHKDVTQEELVKLAGTLAGRL
jgi:hypothetical protein